jgi:CO/xanthine dehydrogenase FAD-binding subunit
VHVHHDGGATPRQVVDLQAVGLDTVQTDGTTTGLGAMVRLQALADDADLPEAVRLAARAEQPSTLRSLATVGGTVATGSGDSLLLASMLAHGAVVRLSSEQSGERMLPLGDLLVEGRHEGELILDVTIETAGTSAIGRTGRTPADVPIIGVVGRRTGDGEGDGDAAVTVLAVCGIGAVPMLIEPDGLESLQPIDDHRSTASYRRHLVEVQVARVLKELS